MRLLDGLWSLLFPPKCILCRRLLKRRELDLCTDCRVNEPESPAARERINFLDSWIALWHYEGDVRRSLLRFKFRGKRCYAQSYGRLLAMKILRERADDFDLITWVPISARRRRRRGYDQVELLANAVCRELDMEPVRCLKKLRDNPPQSGIRDRARRKANVLGVYEAVEPERFAGKRVLLLDDILTTGATAGECARVLLTAGAKKVHCAAVAAARLNKTSR